MTTTTRTRHGRGRRLLSALRRLLEDDPRRSTTWAPPRSHPIDPFELTGSSFH